MATRSERPGWSSNAPNLLGLGGGAFGVLLIALLFRPFAIIQPGHRGVVTHLGQVQPNILGEGFHFILPVRDGIIPIDVRLQTNNIDASAATKDQQSVAAQIAVNWQYDTKELAGTYQNLGDSERVVATLLTPNVPEVVKTATAKMSAEQLLTDRETLKENIERGLRARLDGKGILITNVSVVNVEFSEAFKAAVEAKQVAQQESEKARYLAAKANQEAQALVNRARGEAEAQRLQQQTLTPALLQKQAIEKWDGRFPIVMGGQGSIPLINLDPSKLVGEQK